MANVTKTGKGEDNYVDPNIAATARMLGNDIQNAEQNKQVDAVKKAHEDRSDGGKQDLA